MWIWIAIGLGSFLVLSLVVTFVVARILGTIDLKISEMHATEDWSKMPLSRASKGAEEEQPDPDELDELPAVRAGSLPHRSRGRRG